MDTILSVFVILVIVAWGIAFLGFHADISVHLLVLLALIPVLLRTVFRKEKA